MKVNADFGVIGLADLHRETGLNSVVGALSRRDPVTAQVMDDPNGRTKLEGGDTLYIICIMSPPKVR